MAVFSLAVHCHFFIPQPKGGKFSQRQRRHDNRQWRDNLNNQNAVEGEFNWQKILSNKIVDKILIDDDKSGWVFGNRLSAERGGPKYLTPENVEPILGNNTSFDRYYVKENVMH